jgi:DNA-binding response OmpR family regulator
MKNILSIDDEPMMLKCLSQALASRGYRILVTSDPDEGMRIMREEDISLALLDIKMPQKSGFELYRELRAIKEIPVLFVTAYPKSFNAKSGEVADLWTNQFVDGTTDIIYKPFTLASLFEKVEGLIGAANEAGA